MDPIRTIEEKIVIEKLAVITFDDKVNEPGLRRYLIKNWKTLTVGLNDGSTILFIGGTHGEKSGKLGPAESIQTMINQVGKLNLLEFRWFRDWFRRSAISVDPFLKIHIFN